MQVVIETPAYLTDAKALGLSEDERRSIVDYVAQTPDAGDEMKGRVEHEKFDLPAEAREKVEAIGL
jgi:DNA primase catalytic subunit